MEENCTTCEHRKCAKLNADVIKCKHWELKLKFKTKPKTVDDYEILRDCTIGNLLNEDCICVDAIKFYHKYKNIFEDATPGKSAQGKLNSLFYYHKTGDIKEKLEPILGYLIAYKYIRLKVREPKVKEIWKSDNNNIYKIYKVEKPLFYVMWLNSDNNNKLNSFSRSWIRVHNWQYICNSEDLITHLLKLSEPEKDGK